MDAFVIRNASKPPLEKSGNKMMKKRKRDNEYEHEKRNCLFQDKWYYDSDGRKRDWMLFNTEKTLMFCSSYIKYAINKKASFVVLHATLFLIKTF